MIDTDKYEGHAQEEWCRKSNDLWFHRDGKDIQIADILIRGDGDERYHEDVANARLIADAPKLLAEVKRLQKKVRKLNRVLTDLDEKIHNYESHVELMKAFEQGLELPETWKEMVE
jgi:hypothetical protein|tara:strand:- start:1622 stop:1969 length:348 start_codon:yes stop_codon:yes gene_type:complete